MVLVLVRAAQRDDVGVPFQVVHDLDLAAHVLHVLRGHELALADRLHREPLAGFFVDDEARRAELALAEDLLDCFCMFVWVFAWVFVVCVLFVQGGGVGVLAIVCVW